MSHLNRRSALLLALLAPFAPRVADANSPLSNPADDPGMDMGHDASKYPKSVHWYGNEQVGMLMYPG